MTTTKSNDDMVRDLINEIEVGFADVEADFPDAECGWEADVARSVVQMSDASDFVKKEALRIMGFGSW